MEHYSKLYRLSSLLGLLWLPTTLGGILESGHSCRNIYHSLTSNSSDINFGDDIHGFLCTGEERYHCLRNEQKQDVENCLEWIWMEKGKCPILVSYEGIIHARNCDVTIRGCPNETYMSHYFYKYSECSPEDTKPPNNGKKDESTAPLLLGVLIPLVVILIVGAIIIILLRRRKGKKGNKSITETPLLKQGADAFDQLKDAAAKDLDNFEKSLYVPLTGITNEAKAILAESKTLIITGKKGRGKSALAKHMMIKLRESEKHFVPIYIESHVSNFDVVLNSDQACVVYLTSQQMEEEEEDIIPDAWFKTGNQHLLIFDMSLRFYKKESELVKKLGKGNVIDLSGEKHALKKKDKMDILRGYQYLYKQIYLDESMIDQISETCPEMGFPMACWNYFHNEHARSAGVDYFRKLPQEKGVKKKKAKRDSKVLEVL